MRVIKLAQEGKTTREIAKIVHMSLKDICEIIKKFTGDYKEDSESNKIEEEKKRLCKLSTYAQAFQIFRENKPLTEVVITLDLDADTVLYHYQDYLRLNHMFELVDVYHRLGKDLPLFLHLFNRIKEEGLLNRNQITNLLQTQHKLCDLSETVVNYTNYIENLKTQECQLIKEIDDLKNSMKFNPL